MYVIYRGEVEVRDASQKISKKWLRDKYIEQNMGIIDIALSAGVDEEIIKEKIKEYDLEKEKFPHRSKEWLQKQVEKEENIRDIAEKASVDINTIEAWLKKHNIDYKDQIHDDFQNKELLKKKYVDEGKDIRTIANELRVSKDRIQQEIDKYYLKKKKYPYRYKDWLHKKYIEEMKTPKQMAKISGVERSTIVKWLDKKGFKTFSKYNQDKKFDFGNTSQGAAIMLSEQVKEEIEDIGKDEWSANDVVGLLLRHFGDQVIQILKDIKLGKYEEKWLDKDEKPLENRKED